MDHNSGNKSSRLGGFFLICGFVTLISMLAYLLSSTLYKATPALLITTGEQQSLVLKRNFDHHFYVEVKLNDVPLTLLVDSGASYVAISEQFATKLNLQPLSKVNVDTANGRTTSTLAMIETLDLNGILIKNVKVLIAPNLSPDTGLLGVNILRYFTIVEDKDQMILTVRDHHA